MEKLITHCNIAMQRLALLRFVANAEVVIGGDNVSIVLACDGTEDDARLDVLTLLAGEFAGTVREIHDEISDCEIAFFFE